VNSAMIARVATKRPNSSMKRPLSALRGLSPLSIYKTTVLGAA